MNERKLTRDQAERICEAMGWEVSYPDPCGWMSVHDKGSKLKFSWGHGKTYEGTVQHALEYEFWHSPYFKDGKPTNNCPDEIRKILEEA